MPSKTISVTNGDGSTRTITIPDRSRFAGVRNISRTAGTAPLTDDTTSIQVTVPQRTDLSGVFTTSAPVTGNSTWTRVGGGVTIAPYDFNATDGYDYSIGGSETWGVLNGSDGTDRPWKTIGEPSIISGLPLTETLTVNRTAPVITSDRKGASRPLLSKLVGGAKAAYSLRDLNDRAGNNKVVEVFRSSDDTDRIFLAKEVSNGALEAWVGAGNDGFVSKWYDQSGNGHHAEQAESTKQPKIVSSGSLVKLSDVPAISFDGSSQFFTTTGFSFSPSGDFLAVTVSKISNGNLIDTRDGGSDGFFLQQGSTFRHRYNGDGSINVSGSDQYILATSELNGTTLTAYKNGASAGTDTSVTAGLSTTTNTTIGRVSFTTANYVTGSIQEIILYDTDQSANRPAIEANINNQYDIY